MVLLGLIKITNKILKVCFLFNNKILLTTQLLILMELTMNKIINQIL